MLKLLVSCPVKADGTSFYRGFGPLLHLARHHDVQLIDISDPETEITWDVVMRGDILFVQRPSTYRDLKVIELAKNCNIPVWIDYDDDYLNIPKTNPRYDLYVVPHRVECIKRSIEYADMITVSTLSIREQIAKNTGKAPNKIQVIPNGVDEDLFEICVPGEQSQNNVILWRGGDTHSEDMEPYLDKMVQIYCEFPEYKWAFMGHVNEDFIKRLPSDERLLLYTFEEVTMYFHRLFELRPKMTLVPWEDNTFNRGKSNCSFLESTLTGAVTLFPKWSSEFVDGMIGYNSPEEFYAKAWQALSAAPVLESYREKSIVSLQHFSLDGLNRTRMEILKQLESGRTLLGPSHPKFNIKPEVYNDQQFFNYTWEHLHNQHSENYKKGHFETAQWLFDTYHPKSVMELGCGPGAMIEKFCDLRVQQVIGVELNDKFQSYFLDRNPHYGANYIVGSFLDMELDGVMDLCICIEVFEHIPHKELMPFIEQMSKKFNVLYFSSTPYRSTIKFDEEWGHVNIKTHEAWRALFEENGFEFIDNPHMITPWDLLLHSTHNFDLKADLSEEHITQ